MSGTFVHVKLWTVIYKRGEAVLLNTFANEESMHEWRKNNPPTSTYGNVEAYIPLDEVNIVERSTLSDYLVQHPKALDGNKRQKDRVPP